MTTPTRKFIGSRIRALRKAKGITQAVLAEALQCEIATVSRYERGETPPDSEQLMKLADFLGASPMDILPGQADLTRETVRQLRTKLFEKIYLIENPAALERILRVIEHSEKH